MAAKGEGTGRRRMRCLVCRLHARCLRQFGATAQQLPAALNLPSGPPSHPFLAPHLLRCRAPRCLGMFAGTLEALEAALGFGEAHLGSSEHLTAAVVIAFGGVPVGVSRLGAHWLDERWMARLQQGLVRLMAQADLSVYPHPPPARLAQRVGGVPQLAAALAASGTLRHLLLAACQASAYVPGSTAEPGAIVTVSGAWGLRGCGQVGRQLMHRNQPGLLQSSEIPAVWSGSRVLHASPPPPPPPPTHPPTHTTTTHTHTHTHNVQIAATG